MKDLVPDEVQDGVVIKPPVPVAEAFYGGKIEFHGTMFGNLAGMVTYQGLGEGEGGDWVDIASAYPRPEPDPDDLLVVRLLPRRSNEQ